LRQQLSCTDTRHATNALNPSTRRNSLGAENCVNTSAALMYKSQIVAVSPHSPLTVQIGEDKFASCRTLRQQLSCTDARAATNALHPNTSLTLTHTRRLLASSFFRSSERARAFTERWLSKVNLIIFDTERREDGEVLLLNECARSALPPSRFWRAKKSSSKLLVSICRRRAIQCQHNHSALIMPCSHASRFRAPPWHHTASQSQLPSESRE
jgi:hypothetical protein